MVTWWGDIVITVVFAAGPATVKVTIHFAATGNRAPTVPSMAAAATMVNRATHTDIITGYVNVVVAATNAYDPTTVFKVELTGSVGNTLPRPVAVTRVTVADTVVVVAPVPPEPRYSTPLVATSAIPVIIGPFTGVSPTAADIAALTGYMPVPSGGTYASSVISHGLYLQGGSAGVIAIGLDGVAAAEYDSSYVDPV